MKQKLPERRRYIRVDTPLKLLINSPGRTDEVKSKNISPIGLRFEIGRKLDPSAELDISMYLPNDNTPVTLIAKVIWQDKMSLEDDAPFDVGVDIKSIADEHKNRFLKFLCDLLYETDYKARI